MSYPRDIWSTLEDVVILTMYACTILSFLLMVNLLAIGNRWPWEL